MRGGGGCQDLKVSAPWVCPALGVHTALGLSGPAPGEDRLPGRRVLRAEELSLRPSLSPVPVAPADGLPLDDDPL